MDIEKLSSIENDDSLNQPPLRQGSLVRVICTDRDMIGVIFDFKEEYDYRIHTTIHRICDFNVLQHLSDVVHTGKHLEEKQQGGLEAIFQCLFQIQLGNHLNF